MCALLQVDGNHPLQTVTTRTPEKQGRIYRNIMRQSIAQPIDTLQMPAALPLTDMVEVKAEQPAMRQQGVFAPTAELSAEGGIIEASRLEALHIALRDPFFLYQAAQLFGSGTIIVARMTL